MSFHTAINRQKSLKNHSLKALHLPYPLGALYTWSWRYTNFHLESEGSSYTLLIHDWLSACSNCYVIHLQNMKQCFSQFESTVSLWAKHPCGGRICSQSDADSVVIRRSRVLACQEHLCVSILFYLLHLDTSIPLVLPYRRHPSLYEPRSEHLPNITSHRLYHDKTPPSPPSVPSKSP
jgi:hypothetical protein